MKEAERRSYQSEIRVMDRNGGRWLQGHAAIFNELSEDLGGFREMIDPGAFEDTMTADVRALKNHDPNLILGRTKAGTLELRTDDRGLVYEVMLPNTQYARDLEESVRRGDISQSSFAFRALDDKWEKRDGINVRTVKRAELIDVSPVTYAAYEATDVSAARRSLEHWTQVKSGLDKENRDRIRRYEIEQAEWEAALEGSKR